MKFLIFLIVILVVGCDSLQKRPSMDLMFPDLYGTNPDCMNKNSHIRYLYGLKDLKTLPEDDRKSYDQFINQYIARLEYYCQ
jgi:hypothetical protein